MGVGCGTQGEEKNCIITLGVRWGWDVAHRVKNRIASWVSRGNLEKTHHLEGTGTQGIMLRWCFKKQNGIARSAFIWLWRGINSGLYGTW